ncbi:amidohydrolase family protein [Cyanobium sp. HWJ4-Hawea]|uniref:amidohydrolase family protein n=1 Tax=unclassified Cyanobium TaxID=2627006 RepID=UPI0020CC0366|nr:MULTISPECIES: amidohydrolase family protein [unclassified Cyanobium]MCP9774093.1 amidohydrolase family protein [Cyanobium sp. WAJ14-Wanaka]MCP9807907.1 amidohydrolase family protein [Cyanobium sp. HWJ4-Hawea]
MSLALELRLPRSLLDPRLNDLPSPDADGLVAVRILQESGLVRSIEPLPPQPSNAGLPLALTPLVEPHAHLDKTGTAQAFPNWDGGMAGALAQNQREHGQRSANAVRQRAEALLERSWRYGVRAMRTHIDSGGGPATEASWQALLELRERWRGRLDLQLVALAPLEHWLRPEGEALARRVAGWGGLLGGVLGPPYASRGWANGQDQEALTGLLALAERLGCGLDLHVDEADSQPGRGVALLTRLVLEQRRAVAITCSHCCSMALLPQARLERLAEQMARAQLAVVALPFTNQWLLGRRPGQTPVQRAQAPIRSLQRAGVRVAVGGDNVQDPWFPGGDGDPIELLRFAVPACHLVPSQRQGIAPFTRASSELLGLDWDGVLRLGGPGDLVVLSATNWTELLARTPQRRVLRAGQWLGPAETELPSPLLAKLGQ